MNISIIGHAIVSADGMIADRQRRMPPALRNDADFRRFQAALDRAALVVLGRLGHELHPNPGRRRLVVTSRVPELVPDPHDARAMLWNPAAMPFEAALAALGVVDGTIAVTGGTQVFDLFLPRFDRFDLVTAERVTIPGGVPCFSAGQPADVLAAAGLWADAPARLDGGVTLAVWRR